MPRILSPQQAALLIVDVQNDFCHESGLFGKLGMDMSGVQNAARRIEALLPVARRSGVPIIFVAMQHDASTNSRAWVNRYPTPRADACVAGTWGAEFYCVAPATGESIVVKHRYSPFVGTNIEYLLRAKDRRSVIVTGVATNICVESMLRDAFARDYDVVLVEDCAGAYSKQAHQSSVDNTRAFSWPGYRLRGAYALLVVELDQPRRRCVTGRLKTQEGTPECQTSIFTTSKPWASRWANTTT